MDEPVARGNSPIRNARAAAVARAKADPAPGDRLRGSSWPDGSASALGRLGNLEVRLAASAAEVRQAQALRHEVFRKDMSAAVGGCRPRPQLDADRFDRACDHLLVIDRGSRGPPSSRPQTQVAGATRLLRQERARWLGGFYTAEEFDLAPLLRRHADLQFLEIGRSCVAEPYRTRRAVELLWHGVWVYALRHRVDVLIGCASLTGVDPDRLSLPLSFLHHAAAAPPEWHVRAHERLRVEMNRMPRSGIDPRTALRCLPPLIRGYLRLGAFVGDGAVVDPEFGTTDICIVLPVAAISRRYLRRFRPDAGRFAM